MFATIASGSLFVTITQVVGVINGNASSMLRPSFAASLSWIRIGDAGVRLASLAVLHARSTAAAGRRSDGG